MRSRTIAFLVLAAIAACQSTAPLPATTDGPAPGEDASINPLLDLAPPPEVGAPPDLTQCFSTLNATLRTKVDLLFMVDNSNSMDAMAAQLRSRFSQFLQPFANVAQSGIPVDLQLGVVTSDYGAGATGAPGCDSSPGGQKGALQAIGVAAAPGCKAPLGAPYIRFAFQPGGAAGANNLPSGQTLIDTFTCMASVGANGCGFEHQLESVYAALQDVPGTNAGFLRRDALLVVVFVTNEDDASAPPSTDVFDKSLAARYGYEDSFSRQTRFAIVCGNPPQLPPYGDSGGPLTNCVGAPNVGGGGPGKQYDVSRYVDFFSKPLPLGGVKADPNDVILFAIDAPSSPFQVILSNPGTAGGKAYPACAQLDEHANPPCVPVLQHSCVNPQQTSFFGDPAVRINTVVNAAQTHGIASICDSDYSAALQSLGNQVASQLSGAACVPQALPDPQRPDCIVSDTTRNPDNTTTIVSLPHCTGGNAPCWKVEGKPACVGASPQGIGVTIDRGGGMQPANTTTDVRCSVNCN